MNIELNWNTIDWWVNTYLMIGVHDIDLRIESDDTLTVRWYCEDSGHTLALGVREWLETDPDIDLFFIDADGDMIDDFVDRITDKLLRRYRDYLNQQLAKLRLLYRPC